MSRRPRLTRRAESCLRQGLLFSSIIFESFPEDPGARSLTSGGMASLPSLPTEIPDLSQIQSSLGSLLARLRTDADEVVHSLAKQCQVLSSNIYGSNVPRTVQVTTPPEEDRKNQEKRPSVQSRDDKDRQSLDTPKESKTITNSILFLHEEEANQEYLQSWWVDNYLQNILQIYPSTKSNASLSINCDYDLHHS